MARGGDLRQHLHFCLPLRGVAPLVNLVPYVRISVEEHLDTLLALIDGQCDEILQFRLCVLVLREARRRRWSLDLQGGHELGVRTRRLDQRPITRVSGRDGRKGHRRHQADKGDDCSDRS